MTLEDLRHFPETVWRKLRELSRKLWVRVLLYGALAILSLMIASPAGWILPDVVQEYLAGRGVDRLLNIIANAMLAVTTFSLTVMVTVHRNTSTQWTPRLHMLVMEDTVTQRTLATFIGAYVFALVAIVLRELGVFPDAQTSVLFLVTVFVIVAIVYSLIRWVLHLQTFGSLLASTRTIESETCNSLRARLSRPCLGATPLTDAVPEDATAIVATEAGYVQMLYEQKLQSIAHEHDLDIYVPVPIGGFVSHRQPYLYVTGDVGDEVRDSIKNAVVLGDVRLADQDPRFGLIMLSEIGSKALSPGINDAGTAIDVITRIERILSLYKDERDAHDIEFERLHIPPLSADDLLEDGLGQIARDGAGDYPVQCRLQKTYDALRRHPDDGMCDAAFDAAKSAYVRAMQDLTHEQDKQALSARVPDDIKPD
ncbi:DUF2254 domain-containing protein [Shimia ponticola]|uniref:DUF2254 domain-containing protein n=1 Tax=Shimia ponticola TaxID=2582893 RepID=UPI0011BD8F96|nr:DUF2254 domain-containing protein [Shimia ponticola]